MLCTKTSPCNVSLHRIILRWERNSSLVNLHGNVTLVLEHREGRILQVAGQRSLEEGSISRRCYLWKTTNLLQQQPSLPDDRSPCLPWNSRCFLSAQRSKWWIPSRRNQCRYAPNIMFVSCLRWEGRLCRHLGQRGNAVSWPFRGKQARGRC